MLHRFVARQLMQPSGWFGRHVLPRVWNRRNAALNDAALARLALQPADRVLDVGFGGGYLIGRMLEQVTAGHVSGVDASALMVERGRARLARFIAAGRLDLACAPVEALPYPDAHFGKTVSVNSLFYWPDLPRGLREVQRVLAPGGLLVLVYTWQQDLDKRGFAPFGVRSVSDEEVRSATEAEDLRDVVVEHETDRYRSYSIVSARKQDYAP